jgi:carbon storage regulator
MLVLSRKKGEEILVPECGVTVKVVAVQGQTIRLGIAAPAEVAILRGEIWERDGQRPRRESARS